MMKTHDSVALRLLLRPVLLSIAFVLPACTQQPGEPTAPTPTVIDEFWQQILLDGQPAGFGHTRVVRTVDGHIDSESSQTLRLKRAGEIMQVTTTSQVLETDEGEVLELTTRALLSKVERVVTARVVGEKLVVSNAGRTEEQPYDPRARGPYWIDRASRERLKKAGDVVSTVKIFPEVQRCGEITITLGESESVDVDGTPMTLSRRTTETDLLPGKPEVEWIDESGKVQKAEFDIMGMTFTVLLSSKEDAVALRDSTPEILLSTAIRPDRPLPSGREITYRLSLRDGNFDQLTGGGAFRGSGQHVIEKPTPSVRVVRIASTLPKDKVQRPVPGSPELVGFLQPSSFVQCDHPKIRKTAKQVCDGETDAFEAAKRLERWVHDHISSKNLQTAFASALEAFESATGDCTEHGVLLAALARAVGIPARLVTGLVYHEGQFIGHLWTEVYIDRWIALDATRGQGAVGPDHIALATSSLSDSAFGEVILQLAQILGNLEIEILE